MDRLGYAAASGMRAAMARQTVVSNNLANANTIGFRGDLSNSRALYIQAKGVGVPGVTSRAMASEEVVSANMAEGAFNHTGNPLDIAMQGDALLTVQADDGQEAYTRRGDLQINDSGLLTNGEGKPVLGEGGPITLPPNDKVAIDHDGTIRIVPAGAPPTTMVVVDRLKLVSPAGSQVVKGLDGLFRVRNGGALPTDPEAKLESETLEGSNVNASLALVEMIEASRSWDNQVKMLASAKEIDTDASKLMAVD
ncbi:MAG TPA: flagellar basal body rod protein FlgF [Sphingomonas sp.]|jgi:flagellar basal-body rod protein FlgF|uniref:flagellar basal body rod protein FlgF n=1 Tax=Sphingomonas sp. TaxID=28214 RepID=UPI002EDB7D87